MTWILPEAEHVPSPHVYRDRTKGKYKRLTPVLLIFHYAVDGDQSRDDDLDYNFIPRMRSHDCMDVAQGFAKPERDASTHFVIGRDGSKAQCVRLADACWGAGDHGLSRFPDAVPASINDVPFRSRYVNLISTQIEFCNVGWDVTHFKIPASERVVAKHAAQRREREWERYTDEQYSTGAYLLSQIVINQPTLRWTCGHEDVTNTHTMGKPGGKTDPGPAFDWDRIPLRDLGITRVRYDFKSRMFVVA